MTATLGYGDGVFRRRLRLSAAAATGLLIAATAAAPASTAAPRVDDPAVDVTIESFSPVTPKPDQDVVITGQVRNTGSVALEKPQAAVCLQRDRMSTRADLAAVPAEDDRPVNERNSCRRLAGEAFQAFGTTLRPGATARFDFTVPWDWWRITREPGVYVVGIQVRADDPAGSGSRVTVGQARTLMPVITAEPPPGRIRTAVTLPLLHRPTLLAGDLYANESLAQSLAPNGTLGRRLTAARGRPVTWIVDPALLDEVRGLINGYRVLGADGRTTTPGTGQQIARDWFAAFTATRAKNTVILLPYGDPDVAGLIDAGQPLRDLVGRARTMTAEAQLTGGRPARSGLWLESGSADGGNLAAATTGYPGIRRATDVNLVPSSAWNPGERPTLRPSPVYDVSTPEGPVPSVRTVISDSALTAGGPDPGSAGSALQVRQRFAAETSLLAAAGSGPITVVASVPRTADTTDGVTAGLLQGLSLPWITPVGLDQVLPAPTARPATAAPPTATRGTPALSGGRLDQVKKLNSSIEVFTSLLTNPDSVEDNLYAALLRATSLDWWGRAKEAQAFAGYQQRGLDGQLGKVHLVRPNGSTDGSHREIRVNLSGSNGVFPLTIANELDQSVRIGIQVQSVNRTDLRIEPITTVTLKAKGKATFQIQASAEQNGLIRARAQVVSADGQPVGPPQDLVVQAAQYGSVGWILVGAAVALLFGTSLVRIYRRVRSERRNPAPQPPRPDPLNPPPLNPDAAGATAAGAGGSPAPEPNPLAPVPVPPGGSRANGVPDEPGPDDDVPRDLKEGVGTKDG